MQSTVLFKSIGSVVVTTLRVVGKSKVQDMLPGGSNTSYMDEKNGFMDFSKNNLFHESQEDSPKSPQNK